MECPICFDHYNRFSKFNSWFQRFASRGYNIFFNVPECDLTNENYKHKLECICGLVFESKLDFDLHCISSTLIFPAFSRREHERTRTLDRSNF